MLNPKESVPSQSAPLSWCQWWFRFIEITQFRANYPPILKQDPLSALPNALWIMTLFTLAGEQTLFLTQCERLWLFPPILSGGLSSGSCSSFTYMCLSTLLKTWRGPSMGLWRSFFLWLSLLWDCVLWIAAALISLDSSLSSQLRDSAEICLCFFSLHGGWKLSQGRRMG